MSTKFPNYAMPMRPYSLKEAFQRLATATGSVFSATTGHHAEYNGHRVSVTWNQFRRYFVAGYNWAGWNVLARGDFQHTLDSALQEYFRGAKGAMVIAHPRSQEDVDLCLKKGLVLFSEAQAQEALWMDDRYGKVGEARRNERELGIPSSWLINSVSAAEYNERVKEFLHRRTG